MKNLTNYHLQKKEQLSVFMKNFFEEQKNIYAEGPMHVALSRLEHFSTQGKMLRGIFVILSYEMYGGVVTDSVLRLAAAIELTHATLLVHDDIMDNDQKRRNEPTMFMQYALDAQGLQLSDTTSYGKSVAMIVGDIALLLAYELLSSVEATQVLKEEIQVIFSREMVRVAGGQLLDFDFGQSVQLPKEKDIESMYMLKTGGYTFTLPFLCGSLLAEVNKDEQEKLRELTHVLGSTFQLKDDELGIMGDSDVTGKSPGSDVREGKKTLLWVRLYSACSDEEKKLLKSYLGSTLTQNDIKNIRELLQKYGITETIQREINNITIRAYATIASLNIEDAYKVLLRELTDYNATRSA